MKPAKLVSRGDCSELVSLYPITDVKGPLEGTIELERQELREPQPARPTGPLTGQYLLKNSSGDLWGQNTGVTCVQASLPSPQIQSPDPLGGSAQDTLPPVPKHWPRVWELQKPETQGRDHCPGPRPCSWTQGVPPHGAAHPSPSSCARCPESCSTCLAPTWAICAGAPSPLTPSLFWNPLKTNICTRSEKHKSKVFLCTVVPGQTTSFRGAGRAGSARSWNTGSGHGGPPTAFTRPSQAFPKPTAQKGRHSQSGLWTDVLT